VELDGVCVPLLLDTGAALSLLNWSTVKRFLPHITLQTPSAVLHGYGNSKIDLVASLSCPVRHGNTSLATFTFQVARHGAKIFYNNTIKSEEGRNASDKFILCSSTIYIKLTLL
jgi:hypothetical protein